MAAGEEKKDASISYTYWVDKSGNSAKNEAPRTAPRKLSQHEVQKMAHSNSQGSLWNEGGTWEERGVSEWAKARVKEKLQFSQTVELAGDTPTLTVEVLSCCGEASVLIVRNKKRHGYSFELTLKFRGTCSPSFKASEEVSGTLRMEDVSCGELDDMEGEVSIDDASSLTGDQVYQLTKAVKSLLPTARQRMADFEAELKER
eukprot:TRINITY_DN26700_c0_g1_i1.p1 TRINITY_DN26700_c0_g1~~TRINITY_DN26700_c0_g1_i1.p1  ORF type:complete len:202 (-),score=54.15 TRINITY_DN26700_c0_g1_i1:955-1560(-)